MLSLDACHKIQAWFSYIVTTLKGCEWADIYVGGFGVPKRKENNTLPLKS